MVIRRDGIMQSHELGDGVCRRFGEQAAHARGKDDAGFYFNIYSVGICMIGGVDEDGVPDDNFTEEQWATLRHTVKDLTTRFNIPFHRVVGHRDLISQFNTPDGPKACPCFDVQCWVARVFEVGDPSRDEMDSAIGKDENGYRAIHTAREGDTFWRIGELYGITQPRLKMMNPSYPSLSIGQKVRLRGSR
jgi:hypothetical protein